MKKYLIILASVLFVTSAAAQTIKVGGTVTSESDGETIPGVFVVVKGTSQGTSTDIDGKYSIEVRSGATLQFSSIGYETAEFAVNGPKLDVVLKTDSYVLDEVVAIGYGVMKKSDLTGSVASVKGDQLQKTPAAGLDQALQGVAAGVTVNASSGQPGAAAEVRIRGIGTVNGAAPIYVVDGVIVDNITYLSPNDIVSTEILKDASATAIYGSRGANGVILVTTKKGGSDDKINVSFDAYAGVQTRWKTLDLMGAQEFARTRAILSGNPAQLRVLESRGINEWLSEYLIGVIGWFPVNNGYYSNIDTDWQDEVFRPAAIQNYHVSVDKGGKKGYWSMSANWFDQQGTIIGSDFTRTSVRLNSAYDICDWLRLGENLTFMMSHGRNAMNNSAAAGASIISAAIAMAPWDPVRYGEGAVNVRGEDLSGRLSASSNFKNAPNPYSMVEYSHPSDKTERWVGDVFLEIKPVKGLVIRSDVSMDLNYTRHRLFKDAYQNSEYDRMDKNFIESSTSRWMTWVVENTATYTRDIGRHSFSAMIGQTTEEYSYESIGGSGANILNPIPSNWYISQATEDISKPGESASRSRRVAALGRLHYSYDSRYMITVNFRADGSSKFVEHRWGFFPSAAAAWRMKNEPWLKDVHWLEDLKVRLGWGRIGNDKIGDNSFLLTMFNTGPTFVDYPLGPGEQELVNGSTILTYVNSGGKWETTEQWNVGVDFGFFKNRLTGSLELFNRDTYDMLLGVKGPAHVGNRYDATANVGTVRNQGIELTLNHRNQVGAVGYSVGGNISFIKNRLTALNGGEKVWGDRTVSDEGLPLYTFWGYQYDGIYRSEEEIRNHLFAEGAAAGINPGDAKYRDLNNDGKIDDLDKTALGNPFPWLTYGLNFSMDWKGLDVQLFFQGVAGNKIYNALRLRTEGTGNDATLSTSMRNVWTAENPDGTIPNPKGSPMNKADSDRFVEKGDYCRLKNLQIGYTVPQRLTQKIRMDRFRVYVSANNLLTLTKYSGYDPEVGSGVDYGNYPQSRTFMLGVNVNF